MAPRSKLLTGDAEQDGSAAPAFNFTLFAAAYTSVAIGGSGRVFGTGSPEPIHIRDLPGTITFDASFNRGGDEIHLSGDADQWTVVQDGSAARFSDGDTNAIVPIGQDGPVVIFDDGPRSLRFDLNGVAKIGNQSIGLEPEPVLAAPLDKYFGIDTPMQNPMTLLVSPGDPVQAYGNGPITVYGTADEEHVIVEGGRMLFDASFNRGGDIITFQMSAADVTAEIEGSAVRFYNTAESRYLDVTIPVGIAGIELAFDEGSRSLFYDQASEQIVLGDQVITADPTALSTFG